jgi:D-sedoheptulose 7-phosphate isomerase
MAGDNGRGDPAAAALYPFLSAGRGDLGAVLAEVRRSTEEKAHEIVALRRLVAERDGDRLSACARLMAARFAAGGRLLAFGNGGSATDAQDLARLFLSSRGAQPEPGCGGGEHPPRDIGGAQPEPDRDGGEHPPRDIGGALPDPEPDRDGGGRRPALPAFALPNDIAVVTALTNDVGFDVAFARQIAAFGRRQDIAVGLSTSGNSGNLLRAFDEASRRGLLTVGIAGYDGGKMAELSSIDQLFVVPSPSVHRIQEAQTTIYHVLWELTVDALEHGPHWEA